MKHERPPGRHPRNLRGRRARPLVAVRGKTSYIQCRAQRVLASEDDHLEGAHAAPRDLAVHAERGGCPRCTERRLHHTTRRFRCWKRRQQRRFWRSDRCGRTRAANTARSAQSRPGRGSVRRRTATSSTLCPQQGLLQDHAEGPCSIPQTDGRRCRRPRGRRRSRRADSTLIVSACMPAIPRPVSPGVTGDPCGCAFSPRMRASCLDGPSNGPSTAERGGAPALVWVRFG